MRYCSKYVPDLTKKKCVNISNQYGRSSRAFVLCTPYVLTPWSRILLEKLTGSQLVKKLPAFYGTRRFVTAFASALHHEPS